MPRAAVQASESIFDTHTEVSLDFRHIKKALERGYEKPFLLIDPEIIRLKTRRFAQAMPRVKPYYAVKANPDPRVVQVLKDEGTGFEIASVAELDLLLGLGVAAREVFYSNPMKSRAYIEYAAGKGVEWFVVDSAEEVAKVVAIKPDAKLYLRIDTPNIGADWPLAGKFGAHLVDVPEIVAAAARLKADVAGVTFHVGSQCRNPQNWRVAIERSRAVFDQLLAVGMRPRMLNIGGGFPVRYVKPIPSIEVIGEVVNEALEAFPADVEVVAEPGRYLVSDAAYFVCRVVGTATRAGRRWMYWDAGLFGGMIETSEGLRYQILTDRTGPMVPWCVAGPTCDSVDIVLQEEMLPEDMQEGDFIYIPNAGAYTTAYASTFNGFPLPEVIVL